MLGVLALSFIEFSSPIDQGAPFDLGRGAIAGALIVGAAFLAGYAALRRSGLALCALLMVAVGAALEFSWLGFFAASADVRILLLGLFAASAIIFLSASIGAARYNPLLGGVMFTAALVLGGLGFINFLDRIDVAPLMRWAAIGVGGFGVLLALTQAFRGDAGARLVLPGLALALLAPLAGPLGAAEASAAALLPHGLFTLGVLGASLVALTEAGMKVGVSAPAAPAASIFLSEDDASAEKPAKTYDDEVTPSRERAEIIIDSQLGRVLDYSGVAIWDWSPELIDQTESLPALLGADSPAMFTPKALRNFIHAKDLSKFDEEVLALEDGPFDVALTLFDGRRMRMRGARAVLEDEGELERIVAFIEPAVEETLSNGVDGGAVQTATTAAIVPAPSSAAEESEPTPRKEAAPRVDLKMLEPAFQPIVSLGDMAVVGFEALARLRGNESGDDAEAVMRAVEASGQTYDLAVAMLEHAAKRLSAERTNAVDKDAPPFVAMNVSWGQMKSPAFAIAVADVMNRYALPKGALVLELTEGEAVSDEGDAAKVFRELKAAGAALAFDDFGAGFSCLANLRKYDFDYMKIDKSFATDLESKGDGAKIVASLAAMGADLGLKVIVEGIESEAAAKAAAAMGCAYGQGYALGRPVGGDRKTQDQSNDSNQSARHSTDNESQETTSPAAAEDDIETKTLAGVGSDLDGDVEKTGRWRPWRRA